MELPNTSLLRVICPLALLLGTMAHAAPFDERVKSPRAAASQEAQLKLKAHFDTFQRKREEQPGAFIRDRAAHRQWSDLYYAIMLAMDEGRPLGDLSEFGLIGDSNRAYTVDLKKFPQWAPLDSRLYVLTNPDLLESYVPALKARGYRDADVDTLRTYVAAHDPRQLMIAEGKSLADTFAKRVRQRDAAGLPTDMEEVRAFWYQKAKIRAEGERQWAVGLLDGLDQQRQRILASFFEELDAKQSFGVPTEPFQQTLEREVARLRSGEYLQLIAYEETQIQQDMANRTEKLIGGQQK
jgi:hypothetical protein